jgi:hypothetical protein
MGVTMNDDDNSIAFSPRRILFLFPKK